MTILHCEGPHPDTCYLHPPCCSEYHCWKMVIKLKKIHPSAIFGNIPAYIVSTVISLASYHVSVLDD